MPAGRAYGRPSESPHHTARAREERIRQHNIQYRCHGRRKSTDKNPLPHVYQDVGGDCMGCKHCPRVRTLTHAEYRAKYGVDRPPPRQEQAGAADGWTVAMAILVVVAVLVLILIHNARGGAQ